MLGFNRAKIECRRLGARVLDSRFRRQSAVAMTPASVGLLSFRSRALPILIATFWGANGVCAPTEISQQETTRGSNVQSLRSGMYLFTEAGGQMLLGVDNADDVYGSMTKAVWGVRARGLSLGLALTLRRLRAYQPDAPLVDLEAGLDHRLELATIGFASQWLMGSFEGEGVVEGGRADLNRSDRSTRLLARGGSLGVGYILFQNDYIRFNTKVSYFFYLLQQDALIRGVSLTLGMNLNDSQSKPLKKFRGLFD